MSAQSDDLDRPLYVAGSRKAAFKVLGIGLLLLGGGAFLLYAGKSPLFSDGEQAYDHFLGVACVLGGLVFVFLHLRQVASAKPLLTLSRRGARLNIDGRTFVDVPWNEVSDVTALDVSERITRPTGPIERLKPRGKGQGYYTRIDTITRTGVTALRVSDAFYDSGIEPRLAQVRRNQSLFDMSGMAAMVKSPSMMWRSGLANIFIRRDGARYVLLHHSILAVDRDTLRGAVEDRWHAFRRKGAGGNEGGSPAS